MVDIFYHKRLCLKRGFCEIFDYFLQLFFRESIIYEKHVRGEDMKRILSAILVVLLLCGLTACMAAPAGQQTVDLPIVTKAPTEPAKTQAPATEAPLSTGAATEAPTDAPETQAPATDAPATEAGLTVTEDGVYDSKEEVALYIHLYGHLPSNYITKNQAEKLGWPGGSLELYAPGKCIGGSRFGNYEGLLPDAKGRKWTECDIDTLGAKSRGAKRIVFSNDGLIYYTADHYEHFELLYGEEG